MGQNMNIFTTAAHTHKYTQEVAAKGKRHCHKGWGCWQRADTNMLLCLSW